MELHLYMCIYSTVHLRTAYRTALSTIPTVDRGWGTGRLSMLAAGRASRRSQPALMDWGFMQILNFPIELVAAVFRRLEDWHAAEGGYRCMCVCVCLCRCMFMWFTEVNLQSEAPISAIWAFGAG